jgi:hypothetical protein
MEHPFHSGYGSRQGGAVFHVAQANVNPLAEKPVGSLARPDKRANRFSAGDQVIDHMTANKSSGASNKHGHVYIAFITSPKRFDDTHLPTDSSERGAARGLMIGFILARSL